VGLGVTEIEARDVDGVLEAIRAGRTKFRKKDAAKVLHREYCDIYLQGYCEEYEKGLGDGFEPANRSRFYLNKNQLFIRCMRILLVF